MAIAAGFVMVNVADRFVSPELNKFGGLLRVTEHDQPRVTALVIEKVLEIPRRATTSAHGFDALAVVVVDCTNDGSGGVFGGSILRMYRVAEFGRGVPMFRDRRRVSDETQPAWGNDVRAARVR